MKAAPTAAGQPGADDLTERIFRALYQEFDLRAINGTYVAVPKGTPFFCALSLGDIARQISDYEYPGPSASQACRTDRPYHVVRRITGNLRASSAACRPGWARGWSGDRRGAALERRIWICLDVNWVRAAPSRRLAGPSCHSRRVCRPRYPLDSPRRLTAPRRLRGARGGDGSWRCPSPMVPAVRGVTVPRTTCGLWVLRRRSCRR